MNVDMMRKIDYWVGVPLCFLSTCLLKPLYALQAPKKPKNVLLIELSEMGSTILCDPMMQRLKDDGCNLHFVIFRKNEPSLRLLNTVSKENTFTIREDSLFTLVFDVLRFLVWCRQKRIDSVIDLELFSRVTALLTGFSGAVNRVGFHAFHNEGLYRGNMLTHKVAYNPHMHIAKTFIALANALMSGAKEMPYSKKAVLDNEIKLKKADISDAAKSDVKDKIKAAMPIFDGSQDIVIFNANASDLMPLRRWPREYYIELGHKLLESYPNIIILLTGAPSEREGLDVIRVALGERCVNFAGSTTFAELAPLYSVSRLMLTNDSGPAHFAAVTDLPTFVFFGPETPALYGSLGNFTPIYAHLACSPCVSAANHRKSACDDNQCVKVIQPDFVFEVLKKAL
ncbi:MAG: glycosyltransferase family 9 protein [Campylobacterales bacterium]|nr:glycosyltransferase family 9 protein [Campylobacterales bacterium]